MPSPQLDVLEVTFVVILLHASATTLAGLEYIRLRADFGRNGAYAWRVFRTARFSTQNSRPLAKLQDRLFGRRGTVAVIAVQLFAVLAAAALPARSWAQWVALLFSCLAIGLLAWRQRYGEDGADQMNLIVAVTLAITVGPFQSIFVTQVGLAFLAGQMVLAYSSAGFAKLISRVWRSGLAVGMVVNTASYGSQQVGTLLQKFPLVGRMTTWTVIAFEVSAPLWLFLPWPWVVLPMGIGIAFHLSIAFIMGLNNFVFAFLSVYPAFLYTSLRLASLLSV